jgi:CarD family transcriptional regulator
MFKQGDLVVYPAHGVGMIDAIEEKKISGTERTFYILRILDSNTTIMIPVANINSVGLREIISDWEIEKVYEIINDKEVKIAPQPWNQRYREYMDKIKTGEVEELAKVLRNLSVLQNEKGLSFGERKIMETAQNLLVQEISIATKEKAKTVRERLIKIIG